MHPLVSRLLLAAGLPVLAPGAFAKLSFLPPAGGPRAAPLLLPGMTPGAPRPGPAKAALTSYRDAALTTRMIPGPHQTHGYEVLVNGQVLIAQPSIRATPAMLAFARRSRPSAWQRWSPARSETT